jgi:hypothetical protein
MVGTCAARGREGGYDLPVNSSRQPKGSCITVGALDQGNACGPGSVIAAAQMRQHIP